MATYYKYAERSADSQVNWAEVGKGISDMLKEETTIREQKKAAIDQATREFQKTLENAPQGQFQDANKFTNDYAHSMMEQQMIDNRLLKSGQMKLQDFTFRRQNYVDGTSTLFDLQKLYQENYKKKMEGIQSGELQALTGANMASVEGFADFSKSKAVIDPSTGVVNVGIMRPNATTGVLELTNDVAPVNVIKGKILADIPAFKVEEAMNNTVKNLGTSMDYIYQAATKTGAGTVTKLLGIGALQGEAAKHPEFKDSIDKANSAINSTIDSYFANDYNISSVLTQNTGKYSQESFTYDKDVAAKDKSKILLKINQSSGLPIIDKSGAHYKEQETEAREWVKTQLLGKIDDKRDIDVTGTIPYGPQAQQWQYEVGKEKKEAVNAAGAWNQLFTGKTAASKRDAADILLGTPKAQALELLEIDLETQPGSVILKYKDSKNDRVIPMQGSTLFDFASKGVELHGVTDRKLAMQAGGGGTGYGALSDFTGIKSSRAGASGVQDYTPNVQAIAADVVSLIAEDDPATTQKNLINKYSNLGFSFKGRTSGLTEDIIDVTDPTGKTTSFNIDNKDDATALQDLIIKKFDKKAASKIFGAQQSKKPAAKTTVAGGKER
jgi:hypothetical protein